jgi:hypothetical protein
MQKLLNQLVQNSEQKNIPFRELARKVIQAKGENLSAVKDYIIRNNKLPVAGPVNIAKQAGELIYNEAQSDLAEILQLENTSIPTKFRRYKFYNLLADFPMTFLSVLAIYEDDKNNDKNELIKVSSYAGENTILIPGGVVYHWKFAPGGPNFGKKPFREPASISFFRKDWYPTFKNLYQKNVGASAPTVPSERNVDELYNAAEFVWKFDQAVIDNYDKLLTSPNWYKEAAELAKKYVYVGVPKKAFETEKDLNIIDKGKTTLFAIARGPFLLLVDLNVFGLASRLKLAYEKQPSKIVKFWEDKVGGDFGALEKAINQGYKKKPILGGKNNSFDPATVTAALTAASGLIASVNKVLTDINGAKDKLLETLDFGDLNKPNTGGGTGTGTGAGAASPENGAFGLPKQTLIYIGAGLVVVIGLMFYMRKK